MPILLFVMSNWRMIVIPLLILGAGVQGYRLAGQACEKASLEHFKEISDEARKNQNSIDALPDGAALIELRRDWHR